MGAGGRPAVVAVFEARDDVHPHQAAAAQDVRAASTRRLRRLHSELQAPRSQAAAAQGRHTQRPGE
eukprot:5578727-Prymnesium_polylepis.1